MIIQILRWPIRVVSCLFAITSNSLVLFSHFNDSFVLSSNLDRARATDAHEFVYSARSYFNFVSLKIVNDSIVCTAKMARNLIHAFMQNICILCFVIAHESFFDAKLPLR